MKLFFFSSLMFPAKNSPEYTFRQFEFVECGIKWLLDHGKKIEIKGSADKTTWQEIKNQYIQKITNQQNKKKKMLFRNKGFLGSREIIP